MDIQHAAIKGLLKSLGESTTPEMCAWVLDLPDSGKWQAIFAIEHKPESRFREAAALLKTLLTSDTSDTGEWWNIKAVWPDHQERAHALHSMATLLGTRMIGAGKQGLSLAGDIRFVALHLYGINWARSLMIALVEGFDTFNARMFELYPSLSTVVTVMIYTGDIQDKTIVEDDTGAVATFPAYVELPDYPAESKGGLMCEAFSAMPDDGWTSQQLTDHTQLSIAAVRTLVKGFMIDGVIERVRAQHPSGRGLTWVYRRVKIS